MSPVWGLRGYGHWRFGWDALPGGAFGPPQQPGDPPRALPRTLAARRAVCSANAPWVQRLGLRTDWRGATWQVWAVDPTTLQRTTPLPGLASCQRTATFDGWLQQETLRVTPLDPDAYRPGGPHAALLARGALVQPVWRVRGPAGELTLPLAIYRVTQPLPPRPAAGAAPAGAAAVAEDWLTAALRQLTFAPAPTGATLAQLALARIGQGMPAVHDPTTWATLALALVHAAAGGRVRLADVWRTPAWWGTSGPDPGTPPPQFPGTQPVAVRVTTAGPPGGVPYNTPTPVTLSWALDPLPWGSTTPGDLLVLVPAGLPLAPDPFAYPLLVDTLGRVANTVQLTLTVHWGALEAQAWQRDGVWRYWSRQRGWLPLTADSQATVPLQYPPGPQSAPPPAAPAAPGPWTVWADPGGGGGGAAYSGGPVLPNPWQLAQVTGLDVLRALAADAHLRVTYDYDGWPVARCAATRPDSAFVLTDSPDAGGGIALPAETVTGPALAPSDPPVRRVVSYLPWPQPPPRAGPELRWVLAGGDPTGVTAALVLSDLRSDDPLQPYTGGDHYAWLQGVDRETLFVLRRLDRWPVFQVVPAGDQLELRWDPVVLRHVQRDDLLRLRAALGAGHRLVVELDSAIAQAELGVLVRVDWTALALHGWYELIGVDQPSDLTPQRWTLQWAGAGERLRAGPPPPAPPGVPEERHA